MQELPVSDNWVRDLFILNELENSKNRGTDEEQKEAGTLFVIIVFAIVSIFVSYPMALLIQYRRKDWIAFGITLASIPVFLWLMWPRIQPVESSFEGFFAFNATAGLLVMYSYLIYFFCLRINSRIAKGAPFKLDKKSSFAIFSYGFSLFFILTGILMSFEVVGGFTYWWLSQFMNMHFESLPNARFDVYPRLALPYIIGGTALAISPMQAWFSKRLAHGKSSVPIPILVVAVPAFLFSIFWISVFMRNLLE